MKQKQELVSIIVPIYNAERYLEACLNSIFSQSYKNLEIILVNDGSTDSSANIISTYSQDCRCVVINKENSGQSDCRYIAFNVSKGDFVYFCDADDILEPDSIMTMYNTIVKYDADICCCRFRLLDERHNILKESGMYKQELMTSNSMIIEHALGTKQIKAVLWNKLFRKSFLVENKITPVTSIKLHDDYAFTGLSSIYASKVCFSNQIVYNVIQHSDSISRRLNSVMLTVYDDILGVFRTHLELTNKWGESQIQNGFYYGYAKNVLFVLILICTRAKSYKEYRELYESISKHSYYYSSDLVDKIRCVSKKMYFVYQLSLKSKSFYYMMKLVGKFIKH